jgi:hypothetical protein
MEENKKVYKCKSCGKDDSQVKFYEYLYSKCSECKKKNVKEQRGIKNEKIRDEKISEIDPDEKIRYLWSEMMKEPFLRNGKKSIMDFIEETEQDISDLVMEDQKIKSEFYKAIHILKEEFNSLSKFQQQINEIIDLKVEIKVMEFMKNYNKQNTNN